MSKSPTKGSLAVIFLTVFIDLLGFGIVLPLLPIYADIFGTDPSGFVIGMLMASYSIMQFFFAPVWGSLSDRIGRRPVIIIGLLGSVVFYLAFSVAALYHSLLGLFITRIGAGIAGATIPTAQAYIADTTTKENRARGMALIGVAFGMGFALGPLFAFFAVTSDQADPGAGPGFVAAGLSFVALMMAIFLLPESRDENSAAVKSSRFNLGAWRKAFSSPAMAYLLFGFFVCIFAFGNFETTLSLLIKGSDEIGQTSFNFSFRKVCLTFAFIGFLVALVQGLIVRRIAKFVSEQSLAVSGALIEVVGFGVLTYAVAIVSEAWLFGSMVIIVTGYSCLQPSLYSLISRWTDPSEQGSALGVSQSVGALARIFGSALGIPMLKAFLFLPYIVASVLMLVVGIAVGVACRTGRDFETDGSMSAEQQANET
ncbi:MAG: MFS transporter [Planctomycetota bacterium]